MPLVYCADAAAAHKTPERNTTTTPKRCIGTSHPLDCICLPTTGWSAS